MKTNSRRSAINHNMANWKQKIYCNIPVRLRAENSSLRGNLKNEINEPPKKNGKKIGNEFKIAKPLNAEMIHEITLQTNKKRFLIEWLHRHLSNPSNHIKACLPLRNPIISSRRRGRQWSYLSPPRWLLCLTFGQTAKGKRNCMWSGHFITHQPVCDSQA